MNTSKLADIAEITSSIAILVTLVFLVVQMQQNTAAVEANGLQASFGQDLQYLYTTIANPRLSISRGTATELTDEEKVQLGYYLVAYFRTAEFNWLQYRSGALNKQGWLSNRRPIGVALTTQRVRDWWQKISQVLFDPSLVEEVNSLIFNVPVNEQFAQIIWVE
jgi:hypothetical protein